MSELIKERAKKSIGKVATCYLHNNFRYHGKITNSDENYIEILDFKTSKYKIIEFEEIKELEVGI